MKQTVKTSRVAGQLEKMFRALNARFFSGELEEAVITLKKTPGAYGHITCGKVWQTGEKQRHEINISTATLDRPIEDTTATLLHEMCHLYNLQHEIQDCSRNGSYHNKKFKAAAEAHGLIIEHDPKIGWSITTPSLELLDFIEEEGWTPLQMKEGGFNFSGFTPKGKGPDGETNTKKSSTRKYTCPMCGNSCRATKAIKIMCMDCMAEMTSEE